MWSPSPGHPVPALRRRERDERPGRLETVERLHALVRDLPQDAPDAAPKGRCHVHAATAPRPACDVERKRIPVQSGGPHNPCVGSVALHCLGAHPISVGEEVRHGHDATARAPCVVQHQLAGGYGVTDIDGTEPVLWAYLAAPGRYHDDGRGIDEFR